MKAWLLISFSLKTLIKKFSKIKLFNIFTLCACVFSFVFGGLITENLYLLKDGECSLSERSHSLYFLFKEGNAKLRHRLYSWLLMTTLFRYVTKCRFAINLQNLRMHCFFRSNCKDLIHMFLFSFKHKFWWETFKYQNKR